MNVRIDHNEVARALERLARRNDGKLTPDVVLDDARSTESALHAAFEWDDAKAGHHWRLMQARALIRSVRIEVLPDVEAPAWVRDPFAAPNVQGYVNLQQSRTNETLARAIVKAESARALGALHKMLDVADTLGRKVDIEQLCERLKRLREDVLAVA